MLPWLSAWRATSGAAGKCPHGIFETLGNHCGVLQKVKVKRCPRVNTDFAASGKLTARFPQFVNAFQPKRHDGDLQVARQNARTLPEG